MTDPIAPIPIQAFEVPCELIDPNPDQPRKHFDQDALQELAQSIRQHGVIEALTVELDPATGRYTLHAGERRLRAAKIAGLPTVPCILRQAGQAKDARRQRLLRAVVENLQRADMTSLEVAQAYQVMHAELHMSDQAIADQVGKSRSTVANARRLLELPPDVQEMANLPGVSERHMAALVPLYQLLSPKMLKKAEKGWCKPSELIERIREGKVNSDTIRDTVSRIIGMNSTDLKEAQFPLDHVFEGERLKVKSPRCDECPLRIKSGNGFRCPDEDCFKRKGEHWKAGQLQQASQASGIPVGDKTDDKWGTIALFYGEDDLLTKIRAAGCPNLRLEWGSYMHSSNQDVPGYPSVRIVCYHEKGRSCACLSKLKAQQTRNDPQRIAERELERQLQRLVDQAGKGIAAAIEAGNTHIWLKILRTISYHSHKKGDDWSIEQIRQSLGETMARNTLSWQARKDIQIAQREIQVLLDNLGVSLPEPETPYQALRRRFDRIQSWLRDLDQDVPTIEQIAGNLDNLQDISVALADLDPGAFAQASTAGFDEELASAMVTLDDLRLLLLNPLFVADQGRIIWLVNAPSLDVNVDGILDQATPWELRYALALLDGRDGSQAQAAILQQRLRELQSEAIAEPQEAALA